MHERKARLIGGTTKRAQSRQFFHTFDRVGYLVKGPPEGGTTKRAQTRQFFHTFDRVGYLTDALAPVIQR
jgi:hypothetical protein